MRATLTALAAVLTLAATSSHAQGHLSRYGGNASVGRTFVHDGVTLYYEVYGTGAPLLLVHGNGGSIASFRAQIEYFRTRYRVIAMDSRDQGKSGDSPDAITYEKMADDLSALITHLKTGPVYALGWSDGGIEVLLLGMRHPEQVKKIASMAANLRPDGAVPETEGLIQAMRASIPDSARNTPAGRRGLKVMQLLTDEPHIDASALEAITAPTLVLAGDHDLIRDEHTLEIYHHLPNSQLAIFPNATHMVPYDQPALFNATVEMFFRTPFVKKDRIADMMKSAMAQQAGS
jgi:pimeloyl-ACP methyl ester carboxylesterase